jgi:DNA polymerase III epsilon subunit-like protein
MIVIDVETTGLLALLERGKDGNMFGGKASIISIAAIDFENPENRFEINCDPFGVEYELDHVLDNPLEFEHVGAEFEEGSIKYNSVSAEHFYGVTLDENDNLIDSEPVGVSEAQAISLFRSWMESIKDKTLAGQNPNSLDRPILIEAAHRAGIELKLSHRAFDIHSLATGFLRSHGMEVPLKRESSAVNGDYIMDLVGIPKEAEQHAEAMDGTLRETEAAYRLIYGKNYLPEFEQYPVPEILRKRD